MADVPLLLMPATPAEQLHLELRADQRQWCLQARDPSGGPLAGPLSVRLIAHTSGEYMEGPVGGGTGDAWAQRWPTHWMPPGAPVSLTVWVGGANYVTAQAETTLSAGP